MSDKKITSLRDLGDHLGEEFEKEMVSLIDKLEAEDPVYMDPFLKQMRNRILYVHSKLEVFLEKIICEKIISPLQYRNVLQEARALDFAYQAFKKVDFDKKRKIAVDLKVLGPKSSDVVSELNKLRIDMAHPDIRRLKTKYKDSRFVRQAKQKIINGISLALGRNYSK